MFPTKPATIAVLVAMIPLGGFGAAFAAIDVKDANDQLELTAILNAKISLVEAIGVVERHVGGKVFEVNMREDNGSAFYEIKSVKTGKIVITTVDPNDGKVVKFKNKGMQEESYNGENYGKLNTFIGSSTTLAQMITTAKKHLGGTAVEASFEDGGLESENEDNTDPLMVKVKIVKKNVVKTVLIDSMTNTIVAVKGEEN